MIGFPQFPPPLIPTRTPTMRNAHAVATRLYPLPINRHHHHQYKSYTSSPSTQVIYLSDKTLESIRDMRFQGNTPFWSYPSPNRHARATFMRNRQTFYFFSLSQPCESGFFLFVCLFFPLPLYLKYLSFPN